MNFNEKLLNSIAEKAKSRDKNICPICLSELNFNEFLVFKNEHLRCPKCYSVDRLRMLYMFLFKKTDLFKKNSSRILHLSPFFYFCYIFKRLYKEKYITAGLNEYCDIQMDIRDIKYKDKSFDVFICSHILEHVENDDKAMQELYRVLSFGGWGIISVPIKGNNTFEDNSILTPEDKEKYFGQKNHVRFYGIDICKKLEKHGFKVKTFESRDFLTEDEIELFNLSRKKLDCKVPIIYCEKQ